MPSRRSAFSNNKMMRGNYTNTQNRQTRSMSQIQTPQQNPYQRPQNHQQSMSTQRMQTRSMSQIQTLQQNPYQRPQNHQQSMRTQRRQTSSMNQIQTTQQNKNLYQWPGYEQSMHTYNNHMPQAQFPKFMTQIKGNPTGSNTIPRNTMANNHIQHMSGSYQPVGPQTIVPFSHSQMPSNQQYATMNNTPSHVSNASTGGNNNALILLPKTALNCKFQILPFYDVIEDIIKPTLLDGSEKSSSTIFTNGIRQNTFIHTMSVEQASLIAMNRDISYGKNDYDFQYQIRICQPKTDVRNEVTDFLPMGLHIRVGRKECVLPRYRSANVHSKRISGPINISSYLKLCPFLDDSDDETFIESKKPLCQEVQNARNL